jgi:hypothetical protein
MSRASSVVMTSPKLRLVRSGSRSLSSGVTRRIPNQENRSHRPFRRSVVCWFKLSELEMFAFTVVAGVAPTSLRNCRELKEAAWLCGLCVPSRLRTVRVRVARLLARPRQTPSPQLQAAARTRAHRTSSSRSGSRSVSGTAVTAMVSPRALKTSMEQPSDKVTGSHEPVGHRGFLGSSRTVMGRSALQLGRWQFEFGSDCPDPARTTWPALPAPESGELGSPCPEVARRCSRQSKLSTRGKNFSSFGGQDAEMRLAWSFRDLPGVVIAVPSSRSSRLPRAWKATMR